MDELFKASRARLDRTKVPNAEDDEVIVLGGGGGPSLPLKPIERPAKDDPSDNRHQDSETQSITRARIDVGDKELGAKVDVKVAIALDEDEDEDRIQIRGRTDTVIRERRRAAARFSVSSAIDDEETEKRLLGLALSQKSQNSAKFHIFETFQMMVLYRKQHRLAQELDRLSKAGAGYLGSDDELDWYGAERQLQEYRKSLSSKISHDRGTDRRLPSISKSIERFLLDQIPEAPLLPRQQATHCRHHQAPPRQFLSE